MSFLTIKKLRELKFFARSFPDSCLFLTIKELRELGFLLALSLIRVFFND
jgi:hypothetical protein